MRTRRDGILGFLMLLAASAASSCGGDDPIPPRAENTAQGCTDCHARQAAAWENFSSHRALYRCGFCHEKADSEPGPGHRTSPWCDRCHSEAGHPPEALRAAGEDKDLLLRTCLACHDPHGSKNIYLIREQILIEPGVSADVDFRNIEGVADYGYAELGSAEGGTNGREPGAGLCEVCHTRTRVFNRDGTGAPHARGRCAGCHDLAVSFGVSPGP